MASVVFLRAVNVGGHQKFQPSVLAKSLSEFDVVNIGAAGTLVVRKAVSAAKLRAAILAKMHFEPELMICPGAKVLDLLHSEPFEKTHGHDDQAGFVSVMTAVPAKMPSLPIERPAGEEWQVRVIAVVGVFALSIRRPIGKNVVYPNAVVEKELGVSATTRSWNTIASIGKILEK